MMSFNRKKKLAFTLMELMVVLVILSIAMAAFAPIITRRNKANNMSVDKIWQWATGGGGIRSGDVFYVPPGNNSVMIGQNQKVGGDNGRLIVNAAGSDFITFKSSGTVVANLSGNTNSLRLGTHVANPGVNSTAFGMGALSDSNPGAQNTAFGQGAGQRSTGINNTFFGYNAGNRVTTGINNTLIGALAGENITTGANITAIGYDACSNVTTQQNKTCIGANSRFIQGISGADTVTNEVFIGSAAMTTNVYIRGRLFVGGGEIVNSDKRLKDIIGENKDGLAQIEKLQIYDYTMKSDTEKAPHVGVVAQDLQKVFPKAVSKAKDGTLVIDKDFILYGLVNAVKDLDKKINDTIARVQALETKHKELVAQSKSLETRLVKLEAKVK